MSWFDFDPEDIWKTKQKISSGSPEQVLKTIDARTGYLYNRIQNPTDAEQLEVMDYTREQWSEFKQQQELWEQEIDELEGYRSRLLSENPQNSVETIKNIIGGGLQQFALSKIPFARQKQAPVITPKGRVIEGELADVELPFNYTGETPLLPSIYEPKMLEERALDLGELGEYNKFIRNIQAGQEKGSPLQLLRAATGKKAPYPIPEAEQRELGLYDILRTPTTEEAGLAAYRVAYPEIGSGYETDAILAGKFARQETMTKEELLELAKARVPRLEQKSYYPAADEGGYIQEMDPIDPIGGEDYSIMGADEIFEEITQAKTEELGRGEQISSTDYGQKYNIGKEIYTTNLVEEYNLSPYQKVSSEIEGITRLSLTLTEATDLFDQTVKNKTPDELMELAEKISILRFSENPYIHIRPDPTEWAGRDFEGLGIYGNEEVGWSLYDMNNPLVETESGSNRYISERIDGDAEAAQFTLQNYIRNQGFDRNESSWMSSQGRDMGTLPNPQDYEEFLVKEDQLYHLPDEPGETYQTKGYTQDPEHWGPEYEAENTIGWSQLSTRTLADGTQSHHAEAIQSDLHQAADSPKRGRRAGYKSDRDRDEQAVIQHLEEGLEDFDIVALPIHGFEETSGKTKYMFKGLRNLDKMKNLVKDIIVDESLEGDMRQANIDLSFGALKVSKMSGELKERDLVFLDQQDAHTNLHAMSTDKEEYAKLRAEYSEADLKKLARKYLIRQAAEEILSAPTDKRYIEKMSEEWIANNPRMLPWKPSDEPISVLDKAGKETLKTIEVPVNNRYYYDLTSSAIPDLPMKGGEWRKSIWRQSINHGLNKGLTKFSWSPAWIQEIHWQSFGAESEEGIHKVADQDLTRLSKKLAKEYGGKFTTEQIVITKADLASGKGGIDEGNIDRVLDAISKDPKKGDIMLGNKFLHADKLLDLEEYPDWTKILINVPTLDLTGKAAERWLRLGYSLAKGGLVQQMSSLGLA